MRWRLGLACVLMWTIQEPAQACNKEGYELPFDFQYADAVVVGTISNYRSVPDQAGAEKIKAIIDSGSADKSLIDYYNMRLSSGAPFPSHALFDIKVSEVLKGAVSRNISARLYPVSACCFGGVVAPSLPLLLEGPMIIALDYRKEAPSRRLVYSVYADSCVGSGLYFSLKPSWTRNTVADARRFLANRKRPSRR